MEVYLIRHTTPAIAPGLIYGRTDVLLADTFKQEKDIIIQQLPLKIDAVFSSPSSRCTLLAAAISETFHLDEDLRELHFGEWEGKTWDTVKREESDYWMEDFLNRRPPGGETMLQMNDRVISFWNKVQSLNYQAIVIVTHGGVIRLICAEVNRIELQNAPGIKVNYGEVIKITTA